VLKKIMKLLKKIGAGRWIWLLLILLMGCSLMIYDQTELDEMLLLAFCALVLFFSEVIAKGAF